MGISEYVFVHYTHGTRGIKKNAPPSERATVQSVRVLGVCNTGLMLQSVMHTRDTLVVL